MKTPYLLAISSFAVHGTASLKTFITILGEKILPVPSLVLNGLTNMGLVRKLDIPFKELLQSSLELAEARDLELILYVGYLGKPEQADFVVELIETYRHLIKTIIVDPVCGDHGRKYVPDEVIEKWPSLVSLSDYVFPNLTELKILTGHTPDANDDIEKYIPIFKAFYPRTQLVLTSVRFAEDTIGIMACGEDRYQYSHAVLPKNFGGTGDAFLAHFILNHFYKKQSFNAALKTAADVTWQLMNHSIEQDSADLILSLPDYTI